MVPMLMCGLLRSNFSLDMIAISFSESTFTWPVDWRPPATEMRQGFLGLVGLRSHGGGLGALGHDTRADGARGTVNATGGRAKRARAAGNVDRQFAHDRSIKNSGPVNAKAPFGRGLSCVLSQRRSNARRNPSVPRVAG